MISRQYQISNNYIFVIQITIQCLKRKFKELSHISIISLKYTYLNNLVLSPESTTEEKNMTWLNHPTPIIPSPKENAERFSSII